MNINPTFFIIMVELLAVESIILIVISALYIRRKYQYRAVLQSIIHATDSSGTERQKVLENTLKDMFEDSEESASQIAAKLVKAESRFHKRLLTTFIEQDYESLSGLSKWTDKLLSPYRAMISELSTTLGNEKKQSKNKMDSLKHTVDTLSKEKGELSEELDSTRQELKGIMSEYVSAFDKEKQLKEKASEHQPAKQVDSTPQAGNVEKQDAGLDAATDEGITVESEEIATDEISIESSEAKDGNIESDEISIDDSDGEDEDMLKAEEPEDHATAPESPAKSDAILDDVDISALTSDEDKPEATEAVADDIPRKVAAQS